jgi:hypothetical protein
VVHAAAGTLVAQKTWHDGETVYLFDWTTDEALRVMVSVGAQATLLTLDDSGVTNTEELLYDGSYYCGEDINAYQCVNGDDLATIVDWGVEWIAAVPSRDGRYVAIIDRDSPGFHVRLISTSDQTFTDIPLSEQDVTTTFLPTWSLDSRFLYLSHYPCAFRLRLSVPALAPAWTHGRVPGC